MSVNPGTRLPALAVAAFLAFCSAGALAQSASEGRVHQGYYFWDFNHTEGEFTLSGAVVDDTGANAENLVSYAIQTAEYSYDFCGIMPLYFKVGLEQIRFEQGSLVKVTRGSQTTVEDLSSRESKSTTGALGLRIRTGSASDMYIEGGVHTYEDDERDAFGAVGDERTYSEIGFRSRIGPYRNFELFQAISEDEIYGIKAELGFRYHSAAGFVVGLGYAQYREINHASNLLGANDLLTFRDRTDLSFSVRFDL